MVAAAFHQVNYDQLLRTVLTLRQDDAVVRALYSLIVRMRFDDVLSVGDWRLEYLYPEIGCSHFRLYRRVEVEPLSDAVRGEIEQQIADAQANLEQLEEQEAATRVYRKRKRVSKAILTLSECLSSLEVILHLHGWQLVGIVDVRSPRMLQRIQWAVAAYFHYILFVDADGAEIIHSAALTPQCAPKHYLAHLFTVEHL